MRRTIKRYKTESSGFTLIELMVVVGIVGVLAALASPLYTEYISKSQVSGALSEINSAKRAIEEKIHGGLTVTEAAALSGSSASVLRLIGLGAASSSRCSSYTSIVSSEGSAAIQCSMVGNSAVEGNTITWSRDLTTTWSCSTTVVSQIAPRACVGV